MRTINNSERAPFARKMEKISERLLTEMDNIKEHKNKLIQLLNKELS